jgi:hypothetical protein
MNKKIYWGVIAQILFIVLYCGSLSVYSTYRVSNVIFMTTIIAVLISVIYVILLMLYTQFVDDMLHLKFAKFVVIFQLLFTMYSTGSFLVLLFDIYKLNLMNIFSTLLVGEIVCLVILLVSFFVISLLFFLVYLNISRNEEDDSGNYNQLYRKGNNKDIFNYEKVPLDSNNQYLPVNNKFQTSDQQELIDV